MARIETLGTLRKADEAEADVVRVDGPKASTLTVRFDTVAVRCRIRLDMGGWEALPRPEDRLIYLTARFVAGWSF